MSKILFSSDWHVHPWRECSQDAGADRLADGLGAVRQLLEAAQAHDCPLVFGGDMKQVRGQWPVPVLNGLLALFREFHDVTVFAIPGNHDGLANGRSGLDAFGELPNFNLFDVPTVEPGVELLGGGCVAFWPWQPTLDRLPGFLEDAKWGKARVLVAHAFLSGAAVGPDYVTPKAGATLEQFGLAGRGRVFDLGLFGDVHKQQVLGLPGATLDVGQTLVSRGLPVAVYPGSPYAQNWGERELDKGALLVDLGAGTVAPVPVRAPRFRVVDATAFAPAKLEGLLYKGHSAEFAGDWAGDFVRLLVSPRADGAVLERIREASGARAFQVVVQRAAPTMKRAEIHAGMPIGKLLAEYVKTRPPADGLSPAAVLAAGRRLLE